MAESHEVVIVGAGVIGCSVAFHLARLGTPDVCVVEKERLPGSGSTSKANGGIRAQFATEVNLRMSLLSMAILDDLAAEIGDPPLYRKAGYLFLTADPARFRAMAAAAEFQRSRGVSVEVLDAGGVRARAPYVDGPIAGGLLDRGFVEAKLDSWLTPRYRDYRRPLMLLFLQSWWNHFFAVRASGPATGR